MLLQADYDMGLDCARALAFDQGGAEVAQHLTSGLAYVQDERYAAGAGMRRSGLCPICTASL